MKLLPHQQNFVDKNPDKAILAWGTRVGKTYAILGWLLKRTGYRFFLVCPKRIKKQWIDHIREEGIKNVDVFTKEEVKKTDLTKYNGMVVDEAHNCSSGLFVKPSELTRVMYNWVRKNPDAPVLLATATPICSSPHNLHTLAALTGIFWNWKNYRNEFYNLVRRPYCPRPFWEAKPDWRKRIKPYAKKVLDIVQLSEIIEVPEQRHHKINIELQDDTLIKINNFADASAPKEWYGKHRLAQFKEKLAKIRELSEDEPKVIVVAKYLEQIEYYRKELSKDRYVIVLTGGTKNQAEAIRETQETDECYFICQADAGEGFAGHSFSLLIFASMSWRFVSYEQMLGRMLHLDKKRANDFYYLLADDKDKKIYAQIQKGKDFSLAGIAEEKK